MKYTTTSLILGSGPTFAVLTMSSILQIIVSLGIPHEIFYTLSIKNMFDKNIKSYMHFKEESTFYLCSKFHPDRCKFSVII